MDYRLTLSGGEYEVGLAVLTRLKKVGGRFSGWSGKSTFFHIGAGDLSWWW